MQDPLKTHKIKKQQNEGEISPILNKIQFTWCENPLFMYYAILYLRFQFMFY